MFLLLVSKPPSSHHTGLGSVYFRSHAMDPDLIVLPQRGQIGSMAIEIRDEKLCDQKAVYDLVSAAFGRSAEAELVERLREDGHSIISLVADENGQIVGNVLLSKMEAPFPALALAPVSVIPTRQRSGIGSALVTEAIHRARSNGWAAVFVLGDPKYYERFGFDRKAAAGFTSPYAGPHFMMLELVRSHTATTGELRHAPAFAALD